MGGLHTPSEEEVQAWRAESRVQEAQREGQVGCTKVPASHSPNICTLTHPPSLAKLQARRVDGRPLVEAVGLQPSEQTTP